MHMQNPSKFPDFLQNPKISTLKKFQIFPPKPKNFQAPYKNLQNSIFTKNFQISRKTHKNFRKIHISVRKFFSANFCTCPYSRTDRTDCTEFRTVRIFSLKTKNVRAASKRAQQKKKKSEKFMSVRPYGRTISVQPYGFRTVRPAHSRPEKRNILPS